MHWFEERHPVDPFLITECGFTFLMLACGEEDYPATVRLLQEEEEVNAVNKFGETALLQAARYAYIDENAALQIVHCLLDAGADINAQNDSGETSLMRATYYGYNALVRELLKSGADVNLRRTDGNTVLSSIEGVPSAARRRKRIIRMLEEAGGIR